jgi:hypothetical protein
MNINLESLIYGDAKSNRGMNRSGEPQIYEHFPAGNRM